jgi:hypothetical protein
MTKMKSKSRDLKKMIRECVKTVIHGRVMGFPFGISMHTIYFENLSIEFVVFLF